MQPFCAPKKRPGGPRRHVRRDSGGKKGPARSYRNSGYGRGGSRDDGANRGANRGGPRHGARQQGRSKPARRTAYGARNGAGGAGAPDGSGFYDAVREKLFEMLGGKVCSGCGFRDSRALGIASRYGEAPFDSVGRGGAISSSWPRYESDPELASTELMVLCLNCNRIREPISRKDSGGAHADKKARERRFPR